jgi:hypothetical protein
MPYSWQNIQYKRRKDAAGLSEKKVAKAVYQKIRSEKIQNS